MYTLDKVLKDSVAAHASDIHFTVGCSPFFRIDGMLIPQEGEKLMPKDMEELLLPILDQRHRKELEENGQTDLAYAIRGVGRFRVSIFKQRGTLASVMQCLPFTIPEAKSLGIPEEVQALLDSKCIAFTAEDSHRYGSPNCEAAGKAGALFGLESLLSINGGKGKFVNGLGGAPGVKALVIGGGVVGRAAISVLHALGAWVTVMDINIGTLRDIGKQFNEEVNTQISNRYNLKKILPEIDVVYNCVRWPKDAKEYMIDREMVRSMEKGSVIVDISNDYGAIETFHETTHENPRYIEEGVVHYCVSNIPGAISQSTSIAYAASVLPHFRSIINNGVAQACAKDGFLRRSLTAYKGYLTHEETSAIQGRPWVRPEDILEIADQKLDLAPSATKSHSDNFIKLEK